MLLLFLRSLLHPHLNCSEHPAGLLKQLWQGKEAVLSPLCSHRSLSALGLHLLIIHVSDMAVSSTNEAVSCLGNL